MNDLTLKLCKKLKKHRIYKVAIGVIIPGHEWMGADNIFAFNECITRNAPALWEIADELEIKYSCGNGWLKIGDEHADQLQTNTDEFDTGIWDLTGKEPVKIG